MPWPLVLIVAGLVVLFMNPWDSPDKLGWTFIGLGAFFYAWALFAMAFVGKRVKALFDSFDEPKRRR